MQRYKRYLLFGIALFILLSFPTILVERMRGKVVGLFSPLLPKHTLSLASSNLELEKMEGENQLLRLEIQKLRSLLDQKAHLAFLEQQLASPQLSSKRLEELQFLSKQLAQAVPAKVIYRDPTSWSSSFWINVGEETNALLNKPLIQKNCPVILGRSLVGAIDYVGKKQSRVRLITDVALKPAVRAARGITQNNALLENLEPLVRHVKTTASLSEDEKKQLLPLLEKYQKRLKQEGAGAHLAKGILQGSGTPLWRSRQHLLRGIGFNYDRADGEGAARELVSGKAIDAPKEPVLPILALSDLLVTTGMDGVFPAGLHVAFVTKIHPLKEGAFTYEIEATPTAKNLDSLQIVFVIPPVGFQEE